MTEDRLVLLIVRRQTGELTHEETGELEGWADETRENRAFLEKVSEEAVYEKELKRWNSIDPARGFAIWQAEMRARRRRARIIRITGWSAAASLLIATLVICLVERRYVTPVQPAAAVAVSRPVLPGRNTATLTLANGQQVLLDSVGQGQLALQGSSRVIKGANGSLAYLRTAVQAEAAVTYNTLATPRSGQYQLKLPDGSLVWLNNVSSIRYPTSFAGKDRTVELTGEAYFEIARDASRPFIIKVRDESVEVLGTSFDIMTYPEEGGTRTTLLTGAVTLRTGKEMVKLRPDEQAQVAAGGGFKIVKDIESQDVVSWKDGFFYFGRTATFEAVMRQLARWYDVEVVYEGKAPEMEFGGKIDRSLPLNDLLKFLDKNQIHLRLEGRKLIVLAN